MLVQKRLQFVENDLAKEPLRARTEQFAEIVSESWIRKWNSVIDTQGIVIPCFLLWCFQIALQQECATFSKSVHTPILTVTPVSWELAAIVRKPIVCEYLNDTIKVLTQRFAMLCYTLARFARKSCMCDVVGSIADARFGRGMSRTAEARYIFSFH